jgi:hypothetical protein
VTTPAICEHRAGPWIDSPIGRELLAQFVENGQLEPTPCDVCSGETEERA